MSALVKLSGKTIAVLAADGVEQVELETSVKGLTEAGAKVKIVAPRTGRIRGMHVHQAGELIRIDQTISSAQASDYDGLLIPGGYISPDILRQSAQARDFVKQFDAVGKPIAFISQAPLLLTSTGLAKNRTLTSWPGVRDDLVNAGATWLNQAVVRDRNWLFGRSPQDLVSFVHEMILFFADEPGTTSLPHPTSSDPQQEMSSETPAQALHWLAAPSVSAMLGLALLGVGVVAVNRGRHKKNSDKPATEQPSDAP